jgi:hypothetical protein
VPCTDALGPGHERGVARLGAAHGRFVVFNTGSTWLNPQALFVRDREEGTTISLGRTPSGDAPDGALYGGEISGDGEWIAFSSNASNLVDPPLPLGNTANVFMTPR